MAEQPNFVGILQKCRRKRNLRHAKQFYWQICTYGLQGLKTVGNHLAPMFVECGSLFDAQQVLTSLDYRNEHSWTSLILGYIEFGQSCHALSLHQKMKEDSVHPSSYTLTAFLGAYTKLKDVERGREVHDEIREKGLESDPFVCNTLVNMYAKSGSMIEARQVFDKLLVQDVVSWNMLIAGYAENGCSLEVLDCLVKMQVECTCPDVITFVCSLKACASEGAISFGRIIHVAISRMGYTGDRSVGNTLVCMYAKCASLVEAQRVFEMLPVRDNVSFNAIITAYVDSELGEEAIKCFEQMQHEGISPNVVTFICILRACAAVGALDKGREIQALLLQMGFEFDLFVGNILVDMYVKCGSLLEAHKVFEKMTARDVVSWTALVAGYVGRGLSQEALECYEQMQMEGIAPNAVTCLSSLKACSSISALIKGREIHTEIVQRGFEREPSIANTLLGMYAECGSLSEVQEVFDRLPAQDVVSWTAIIAAYAVNGLGHEALMCYDEMYYKGIFPTVVAYFFCLKACTSIAALARGREIHTGIAQKDVKNDIIIASALLEMYAKCGSIVEARAAFDNLPIQDNISWTTMITLCAENGLEQEAIDCFEQMQSERIVPTAITFVFMLKSCVKRASIKRVREMHAEIIQGGHEKDSLVGNTLVDIYLKCSSFVEAHEVFDKLLLRDVVCWTALITGYVEYGHAQEALKCFKHMVEEGLSPNAITLVSSLKACGSLGAIERGREFHVQAVQEFKDDVLVGNALVDMYAKCGSPVEAWGVFNTLSHRDLVSWNTLIAGYTENGLGQEALKLFEKMSIEGVLPNAVTFVCILKVCSSLGALSKGREAQSEVSQMGFESDVHVGNMLLNMYVKCGSLEEARQVFNKMPVHNIVSWTAMITGYGEHGSGEQVLQFFELMEKARVSPDAVAFACSLKACGSIGDVVRGREIHATLLEKGLERDLSLGNSLIEMYLALYSVLEAQEVFDNLVARDVVSWTLLMAGYTEHGQYVLNCFDEMLLEGICPDVISFVPILKACATMGAIERGRKIHAKAVQLGLHRDLFIGTTLVDLYGKGGSTSEAQQVFDMLPVRNVVSWNSLIAGYVENGAAIEALERFEEMQLVDVLPNDVTFVYVLKACGNIGAIDKGRELQDLLSKVGLESDSFIGINLVDAYAKSGLVSEARKVFDKFTFSDAAAWNTMIRGYGINYEGNMAVLCFEEMQERGIKPDHSTFVCLLTACSRASLMAQGQKYFEVMKKEYTIEPARDHYTCMVDLFARSGCLYEAEKLLATTKCHPFKEPWIALLSACKAYMEIDLGLQCFWQLVQMHPEHAASYVLMANISEHSGMWNDANRNEELSTTINNTGMASPELNRPVNLYVRGNNEEVQKLSSSFDPKMCNDCYNACNVFYRMQGITIHKSDCACPLDFATESKQSSHIPR